MCLKFTKLLHKKPTNRWTSAINIFKINVLKLYNDLNDIQYINDTIHINI